MEYFYLNYLDKKQTEIEIDILKKIFIINTLFKKLIFIILILVINYFLFNINLKYDIFNFQSLNNVVPNKFFLYKYFNNLNEEKDIYFNITSINYSIELKNNIN